MLDATREDGPGGSGDLFGSRLDQIINMDHEPVRLTRTIDWEWIDGEPADSSSAHGRPATETRFIVTPEGCAAAR